MKYDCEQLVDGFLLLFREADRLQRVGELTERALVLGGA